MLQSISIISCTVLIQVQSPAKRNTARLFLNRHLSRKILDDNLRMHYMVDNDPKHTSRDVQRDLEERLSSETSSSLAFVQLRSNSSLYTNMSA